MDHQDRHRFLLTADATRLTDWLRTSSMRHLNTENQGALDVVPPWFSRRMPARQDYAFWWCR